MRKYLEAAGKHWKGIMKEASVPTNQVLRVMRSPHFWIVVAMFIVAIVLHYPQRLLLPPFLPSLGLTRHAMDRILFLLPMTYAGFIFGMKAGLFSVVIALAIMLPRVLFISSNLYDAVLETGTVILIGSLVNLWFQGYRREREHTQQALLRLDAAQKELQSYIQVIRSSEKRLAAINAVCVAISQSLDLENVLNMATDKVMEVMEVEVAMVFLLNEENQELVLEVYRGVSEEFVAGLRGLKVGEGFNGRVAQTGEPLVIEDASSDPRLTRDVVKREGIQAELIVPLIAKDKVVGTASVAVRGLRQFPSEEVELLTIIGRQVGIAIENARLYQRERVMVEQIAKDAATEKQMRENLSFYLQQVTRAQEEERSRIARELHDETAQDLIALSRQLDSLISRGNRFSSGDTALLEELRQQADRALDGVRRFGQDLRPSVLDDLGLMPALEWLTSDLSQNFGIAIDMKMTGSARRFTPEVELVLFRITQEALRNVWKHSGASEARVTLRFDDGETVLTVEDNGKGFEVPEAIGDLATVGKLGLVGMQERVRLLGGNLTIQSELEEGTTITVAVPA